MYHFDRKMVTSGAKNTFSSHPGLAGEVDQEASEIGNSKPYRELSAVGSSPRYPQGRRVSSTVYVGTLSQPHAANLLRTWDMMQIHAMEQHGGKTTDGKLDVSLFTSPPPLQQKNCFQI